MLWLFNGERIVDPGRSMIANAADAYQLHVSSVSAWELGLLCSPKRRYPVVLSAEPEVWFANIIAEPGVSLLPLDGATAIRSSFLPEPLHDDPADRMLIATARDNNLCLVTRDEKILAYAALGHVLAARC